MNKNEKLAEFINQREGHKQSIIDIYKSELDRLNTQNRLSVEVLESCLLDCNTQLAALKADNIDFDGPGQILWSMLQQRIDQALQEIPLEVRYQYKLERQFIESGLRAYSKITQAVDPIADFMGIAYDLEQHNAELAKQKTDIKQVWDGKSCEFNGCDYRGDYITGLSARNIRYVCKGHTRLSDKGLMEDVWKTRKQEEGRANPPT